MARHTRATSTNTPTRSTPTRRVEPKYLSPEELATWLAIPLRTIRRWRVNGYGPEPAKFGRLLRYPISEVRKFEQDPEGYQYEKEMEIDL